MAEPSFSPSTHRAPSHVRGTLSRAVAGALPAVLDLVVPQMCVACSRPAAGPAQPLCHSCAASLAGAAPTCHEVAGLEVWAASVYGGAVAASIVAHKEHGARALAGPLGALLAAAVRAALATTAAAHLVPVGPLLLVPVPSSAAARRRRGEDPLARIARAAAVALSSTWSAADRASWRTPDLRVRVAPVLRQARRVADQSGLSARQRAENLRGAMTARRRWGPVDRRRAESLPRLVLVDDVVTTGSTLGEATRALRAAGLVPPGVAVPVAVVAASVRRIPPRWDIARGSGT